MTELQALLANPIFIGFVLGLLVGYKTAKGTLSSLKLLDLNQSNAKR